MSFLSFVFIFLIVAILADSFNKYQKTKMRFQGNDKAMRDLKDEIKNLQKRIENLEIIAVSDPDNFNDRAANTYRDPHTYKEEDPTENNKRLVNELARRKQST